MQIYSTPEREEDPYAMPDIEIFFSDILRDINNHVLEAGYYWWWCFPGCLPDSEPIGPFKTYEEALKNVRELEEF